MNAERRGEALYLADIRDAIDKVPSYTAVRLSTICPLREQVGALLRRF